LDQGGIFSCTGLCDWNRTSDGITPLD